MEDELGFALYWEAENYHNCSWVATGRDSPFMKSNDCWFIHKNPLTFPLWAVIILWVLIVMLSYSIIDQRVELNKAKEEINILQSTNIHTWIMDESCSKQLLTSDTLRLKLK